MFYDAPEYDFLRTNPHLKNKIVLLGYGGSHAYGTNVEGSDVDLRGCALNSREEILGGDNFEQFVNEDTDTTIYSFNKLIKLLSSANPNTIEILGLRPEHYFIKTKIGQELLDNKHLFLSKKVVDSFGGYARQQLYRLNQISTRHVPQPELESHILKTLQSIQKRFDNKYTAFGEGELKLYIDNSEKPEYETEIFMDITNLTHYPLRDFCSLWAELQSTVKEYGKIGRRNAYAKDHNKIAKHMMHLVRLQMMCLDILESQQIITYRMNEHDLLMNIRDGVYLDKENQPTDEFYEIVKMYDTKLQYAEKHTELKERPDYKKINEFVISVNERIVSE